MTTLASRAARMSVLVATVLSLPQSARPVLASDALAQVRPMDRRVEALIARGVMRSRTIGKLLDELSRTDVVVYVRSTPRRPGDLAGSMGFMGIGADGRRWLMVTLYGDEGWTTLEDAEDRQLITLGHELRHVLEVAADPGITTATAFAAFYRAIGDEWQKDRVDTQDARIAGRQVAQELSSGPQ
ncbi:hypothetical protein [Luteitalea pratensis]|nr:hypothetical protein [Luteitalea pratensis]